jgi:hypothetical protein
MDETNPIINKPTFLEKPTLQEFMDKMPPEPLINKKGQIRIPPDAIEGIKEILNNAKKKRGPYKKRKRQMQFMEFLEYRFTTPLYKRIYHKLIGKDVPKFNK